MFLLVRCQLTAKFAQFFGVVIVSGSSNPLIAYVLEMRRQARDRLRRARAHDHADMAERYEAAIADWERLLTLYGVKAEDSGNAASEYPED